MKAKIVKEELSFKRGQDPHEKLSIGNGRSIKELVDERLIDSKVTYGHIEEYLEYLRDEDWTTHEPFEELMKVLKHTPIEYQIEWWIGWEQKIIDFKY